MLTKYSRVRQESTLACAEVGEDLVMLHLERNAYYDTDAIGADIWRRMAEPVVVGELCEALVDVYDVDAETCVRDVLAFLEDAHREGVVHVAVESLVSQPAPELVLA